MPPAHASSQAPRRAQVAAQMDLSRPRPPPSQDTSPVSVATLNSPATAGLTATAGWPNVLKTSNHLMAACWVQTLGPEEAGASGWAGLAGPAPPWRLRAHPLLVTVLLPPPDARWPLELPTTLLGELGATLPGCSDFV